VTVWLAIKLVGLVVATAGIGLRTSVDFQRRAAARARMDEGDSEIVDRALVTIEGVVRPHGDPLLAPLSGRPCVAHRSRLRVYNGRGPGRTPVHELSRDRAVAFVLVSDHGDVLVDAERVDLAIRPAPVIPRDLGREQAFLGELVADPHALGSDEIAIEPGQRIRVHGIACVDTARDAVPGDAPDVGYREARQIVRVVGDERHPLTITES
jgi:hypothetical protein